MIASVFASRTRQPRRVHAMSNACDGVQLIQCEDEQLALDKYQPQIRPIADSRSSEMNWGLHHGVCRVGISHQQYD